MARKRGGGYRPPSDYDPRRGKKSRGRRRGEDRHGQEARDRPGSNHSRTSAETPKSPRLPTLSAPPAPLRTAKTRAADVAGRSFTDLGLGDNLGRALAELGAHEPFTIQAVTIPDVLSGHHVLGRARTGSGKTIAFGAALVERLLRLKAEGAFPADVPRDRAKRGERTQRPVAGQARKPKALILAPTRELALQIDRTVQPLARSVGLYTGQFVGGQPFEPQLHALKRGVDIAIGTPGRILDLSKRGRLGLEQIAVTVIDEADHLAEFGFVETVQAILRETRRGGQRLLFSATLDTRVQGLIDEFMPNPAIHQVLGDDVSSGDAEGASEDMPTSLTHRVLIVLREHKDAVLTQLARDGGRTIVFCRTRAYADRVSKLLVEAGLRALPLHGDLGQSRRERNLASFAEGKADVLVATDVAARGIHVDDVDLVLQADPPDDAKTYVHRAGRTGRTGRPGLVLTVIPRTRQKRTRELFAQLGLEPASFADFEPGQPSKSSPWLFQQPETGSN